MSQNSASSSGSTSPTRGSNLNGRAGNANHRYAPSNPSSLREAHRPPSTPGSTHGEPEPYRDDYFASPDRQDVAPDQDAPPEEETIKKHEDVQRRVTAVNGDMQNSPGNYSPPLGTSLSGSGPPTPGWPASYKAPRWRGGSVSSQTGVGATPGLFGDTINVGATQQLAKMHGVRRRWLM